MKLLKKYELDKRSAGDITNQIEKLSKNYVPEWKFDLKRPDAGSVIGIIFADQQSENIKSYNELLEVYHAELVNMLGVSLKPAQVASTNVVLSLVSNLVPGTYLPEHTKLMGVGKNGENLIFETSHPIYVTNSQLTEVFMTSGDDGKIIPVYGTLKRKGLVSEEKKEERENNEEEISLEVTDVTQSASTKNIEDVTEDVLIDAPKIDFSMFDFSKESIERNALLLYHSDCLDITDEQIFMRLSGGEKVIEGIKAGKFKVSYLTSEGFVLVDELQVFDDIVSFKKKEEVLKVTRNGTEMAVLAIESQKPILNEIKVENVDFSSKGEPKPLESAGNGNNDYDVNKFKPFGETLSLFSECFLSMDDYFGRKGAKITLDFDLDYDVRVANLSKEQEDSTLKIIKKKPKTVLNENLSDAYVDEVSIEYLSEAGWKRLEFSSDRTNLFANGEKSHVTLDFVCPGDWESMGASGRSIRIQTQRCDNCYLLPCTHHYPIISNMTVSYSYEGRFVTPELLEAVYGTKTVDLTQKLLSRKGFSAFSKGKYPDNAIYLGFSKPMEAGPISLMFKVSDEATINSVNLVFQYSTRDGFKPLSIIDKTSMFTRSGQIRFMPPEDMAAITLEDRKLYWIRIVDVSRKFSSSDIYRPHIESIYLNSVEVQNVNTADVEDFYLDEITAGMSLPLSTDNILDADVWVNEMGLHKEETMKEMLRNNPSEVRAVYDFKGSIKEFFVKWKEVSSFSLSEKDDRHYILDRTLRRVVFGDGVHVSIPRVVGRTAVSVIARSCDGSNANVDKNTITGSFGNINYLGGITNPFPAYGGGDTETLDNVLSRTAGIIGNRRRLLSLQDYENAVRTSSQNIDKVSVITGEAIDGTKDNNILSIVLLMKDFGQGTHSFDRLAPILKEELLLQNEIGIKQQQLQIVEPIAISISVDIWLSKMIDERDYEVHIKLIEALKEYLSPVRKGLHAGWEIGKLPTRNQILMKLNSLKTGAFIQRLVITGTYTDMTGTHECDLENIPQNRFFVCKSGTHKAHVIDK